MDPLKQRSLGKVGQVDHYYLEWTLKNSVRLERLSKWTFFVLSGPSSRGKVEQVDLLFSRLDPLKQRLRGKFKQVDLILSCVDPLIQRSRGKVEQVDLLLS